MSQEYPKIKICGITKGEELKILIDNQVDYVGFVLFYPKSKRNVTCEQGAALAARLKENMPYVQTVAVVVSPDESQIKEIQKSGFDIIQIHGELDEKVYQKIKLPIFRAFHLTNSFHQEEKSLGNDFQNLLRQIDELDKIKGVVLDGESPGAGQPFDWGKMRDISLTNHLFILAGGLNSENVNQAIHMCQPDIVDVSSHVEGEQGKDACKVKQFVQAVRSAGR